MKPFSIIASLALAAFVFLSASPASASERSKPAKPERIGFGQVVNIQDYLVKGKTVIFDFTSQFCPPCRAIAPRLHKLHESNPDVVVVEVDINRPDVKGIDWQSPVAQKFELHSIPHFKVFGPDGKLKAEGKDARGLVEEMLGK